MCAHRTAAQGIANAIQVHLAEAAVVVKYEGRAVQDRVQALRVDAGLIRGARHRDVGVRVIANIGHNRHTSPVDARERGVARWRAIDPNGNDP